MWIIMNDAFLSVVQNIYDEDELLVRARVEGDIERVFPNAEVFADEGSDYKYRSYLNKREVAKVIEWGVLDIDYGNFKNSVPSSDSKRRIVYDRVWSDLLRLQESVWFIE